MGRFEKRRVTRYPLRLPIQLTQIGGEARSVEAVTDNVSSRAVRFTSALPIALGKSIEFTLELSTLNGRVLFLRCKGRVLRAEVQPTGAWAVVATIERHEYLGAVSAIPGRKSAGKRRSRIPGNV